ncbi:hypothetical protein C8Q70DRAFT_1049002 [Cubamyces menziesii]|uniref:Uncharacterized protein n=1 Tax=Trametes cubensis TaxID=1111947 RepID=A0AAD7U2W3_9APHY|nr:hypothetical protein C8Q70DRAFT_1049002 [Cubamyces menziesii]KAJ8496148.1 hypothetical protein ONZ51_g1281 [Trametes cubensis]
MSIQSQRSDLRLPSYREGFVIRYHPYPRTERRVQDTDLMTVDHRHQDHPPPQNAGEHEIPPVQSQNLARQTPTPQEVVDEAALALHRVVSGVEERSVRLKRRRSLTSLIVDLALAIRNGYRTSRLGKGSPSVAKKD